MFEKLLDKAEILDLRIEEMAEKLVKRHKLLQPPSTAESAQDSTVTAADASALEEDDRFSTEKGALAPQLASISQPSQDVVTVVGRICVDAVGEAKLNAQSILLEVTLPRRWFREVLPSSLRHGIFPVGGDGVGVGRRVPLQRLAGLALC